jgi:Fe-Mn family superoxide dismutase
LYDRYEFQLKPLPYPYHALEPSIDAETVKIHHNNHLGTYVKNLNKILSGYPRYQSWNLERLVRDYKMLPREIQTPVKNNAGGVYNHNLYFDLMGHGGRRAPVGELSDAIYSTFNSFAMFKEEFKKTALDQFGSGYAWLVSDRAGRLRIIGTANQDTPLPMGLCPVLLIDVWEHAYYLKYQYRRAEYIDNWWNVVNWEKALENYRKCVRGRY